MIDSTFLRAFGAVERATLHTALNTLAVKLTANNVVTYTRKVTYTTATQQNQAVLLQVMLFTTDVGSYFFAV